MTLQEQMTEAFQSRYGEAPAVVVRVPGVVCLVGGHTDANGGYVLAMNIDRYTVMALRARDDGVVQVQSLDDENALVFDLNAFDNAPGVWGECIKGAASALGAEGYALRGWEGFVGSELVWDAGVGAAAALMMGAMRAFASVSGFPFKPVDMAQLAYRAAPAWIPAHRSAYADFVSIASGKANEVMLVDAQYRTVETTRLPEEAGMVLLDTGERMSQAHVAALVGARMGEMDVVVQAYRVSHLRDLSMSRFEKDAEEIEDAAFKRARHFMTENGRCILAAEMLRSGAMATVGRLMNDSHASLRDDYDVGQASVEAMVNCVLQQPNVLGARATGAGMSGVAVAVVRALSVDTASKLAVSCYKRETGADAEAFLLRAVGGVDVV